MNIPNHLRVATSNWLLRAVTIAGQVLCIRFLTLGLGVEAYGAFALLMSVQGWCSLCDFGLAGSLQNYISECRGKGQSYEAYIFVAWLLGVVVFGASVLSLILARWPLS